MGLWARLTGRETAARPENTVGNMTIEELVAAMSAGGQSLTGESVTASTAESLAAVGASVRVLSRTIAKTEVQLFKRLDNNRKEKAMSDPLWRLMHDAPNDRLTAFQFKAMLQADKELRGNGYAYIVRGFRNRPVALERLHPDLTRPVLKPDGSIKFRYQGKNGVEEFDPEEVIHLWDWSDDGIVGKSTIQVYRETFGKGLAQRRHGAKFFANGARLSGVLKTPQGAEMSDESVAALRADFNKMYGGGDNAYQVAVLKGGIEYTPISVSMEDAQFIESSQLTATEIAMIFGVPPHKLGILDRATFNNIEHQSIEFVMDSIWPRAKLWEEVLGKRLLPDGSPLFFKFDLKSLLQGDQKSQAERDNLYRRMGVLNANEIREGMDLNPRMDEGGDDYIIESNMALNDGSNPAQPTQITKG